MSTRNYFIFIAILNLLFGISLIFLPNMMTDQYLTDSQTKNTTTDLLSRLFGVLLISLAVGSMIARNAAPSPARTGWIVAALIAQIGNLFIHISAITQGIEKPYALVNVVISSIILIWSIALLMKKEPN